ncbi:hypothetical protein HOP50_03g22270 [Chloropicon primus]|uniref:tRNA-splicing endonuclease subunit Sen54 N-terminal domain-containing protein n=1 Tax=Chloropicon primus TaxID=1764295 RepID=A0A5B8MJZ9_9CHLO|nr:hypothetical protein A3770_03p22280 [Chloropicon primus]UPQ98921.1 hypothetical protein HOP50_03g22270 [Chloropicon primus]|eukprot:QDZ19710.1 hypothetical protein A3770_03p22280 [Chloropicon primus]
MVDVHKKKGRTRQILDKSRDLLGKWASFAVWREELGLAEIIQRRGKLWQNMGMQVKENYFCNAIEAAFMNDRCNLLVSRNHAIMSVRDHFALLLRNSITWQSYFSYNYLKKAGYSLFPNPGSWLNETFDGVKVEPTLARKVSEKAKVAPKGGSDEATKQEEGGPAKAALDSLGRPNKKRRTGGGGEESAPALHAGKALAADAREPESEEQRESRQWWHPMDSEKSWLHGMGEVPKEPKSAFEPIVLRTKTGAFPNLWSFGKKDTFSMDLEEDTFHSFEASVITGNTPGRKKKPDFSVHVPKQKCEGLTWQQAHFAANLSKKQRNKPTKLSFIDGSSVCFFSLSHMSDHPAM